MSDDGTPQPEHPSASRPPYGASAGGAHEAPPTPPRQPNAPPPPYGAQQSPYGAQQSPYGAPPPYAPTPPPPLSEQSDQQAAMWAHIGGIIGFLPSLIIWLVLKDRGPRTAVEGKEALNWQITFAIVLVVLEIGVSVINTVLGFAGLWWLLWLPGLLPLALWVLDVVWSIQGGMKVNSGGGFRYPFNFRFIR